MPRQLSFSFDGELEEPPDSSVQDQPSSDEDPERHPATPVEAVCRDVRQKIHRIRPPVKAHGGKYYLARQIVPILLSAPGKPTEYLEPCAFGASVFLALPRFEREILGDINPDVVQLWRTLAHERLSAVLTERLASVPYGQEAFDAAKSCTPADQVEAAARFIIRSRFSRGGLGTSLDYTC